MSEKKIVLEKEESKGLRRFLILTFILTFLLGIVIYLAKARNFNLERFALGQMLIPALAAMTTNLSLNKKNRKFGKRVYGFYLGFSVYYLLSVIVSELEGLDPKNISLLDNILITAFSILFLVFLNLEEKDMRRALGLNLGKIKDIILISLLFMVLLYLRNFILFYLDGDIEGFKLALSSEKLKLLALLIINIPFAFIPFFGEEYGWRYFLQPLLQKKYGMRKGILLLAVIWGLWHLPLNLFFYSAEGSQFMSLINQIFVCLGLGIFFAYAYTKTKSIWLVTILHYLNNNMILLFTQGVDPSVIEGQDLSWATVALTILVMLLVYGPFIFSKYNSKKELRADTNLERLEKGDMI